MKAWNVAEMELERHHPRVLGSEDEGRVIVLHLPAGETMQEHQVHERAWLIVAAGAIEIDDADGETVGGGPGLLAEFDPNERRRDPRDRGLPPRPRALALARRRAPEPRGGSRTQPQQRRAGRARSPGS